MEIFLRFPAVLRHKLLNGELELPVNTKFTYSPIYAYRAVEREASDIHEVSINDFRSYFELNKKPKMPRGLSLQDIEKDAHFYGVSCFTERKIVEQKMRFPNPHKKLAAGYVIQECGPEETKDFHVCWWLYENVEINSFNLLRE